MPHPGEKCEIVKFILNNPWLLATCKRNNNNKVTTVNKTSFGNIKSLNKARPLEKASCEARMKPLLPPSFVGGGSPWVLPG